MRENRRKMAKIVVCRKYRMNPPFSKTGNKGKITTVLSKANLTKKELIENVFPHHANGMDWYKTEHGWAREDWLEEIEQKKK